MASVCPRPMVWMPALVAVALHALPAHAHAQQPQPAGPGAAPSVSAPALPQASASAPVAEATPAADPAGALLDPGAAVPAAPAPITTDEVVKAIERINNERLGIDRLLLGVRLWRADAVDGQGIQFRPRLLWAVRWGRWRWASAMAAPLLNLASRDTTIGPGLSATFHPDENWHVSASLRLVGGRDATSDPLQLQRPEVKRSVRLRVGARRMLSQHVSFDISGSQDISGRAAGLEVGTGVNYTREIGRRSELSVGAGLSFADGPALRAGYGVLPWAPGTTGVGPAEGYRPGAGPVAAVLGGQLRRAWGKHTVAFADLSFTRYLGNAAASPLIQRDFVSQFSLGFAWHWGGG